MKNKVSMQDIADSIGVSKVTVSKVLRGKSDVSEAMSQKITAAAERLGYVYGSGKKENPLRIAVLSAEHFLGGNECFYVRLYRHLSDEFEKRNIDPILHVVDFKSEAELAVPEKVKSRETDGIVLLGQLSKAYVERVMSLGTPTVFLDFYYDGFDVTSINTDNFFSEYELVNRLIRLGHTKIAFVGTLSATSSIQDRFLGYYKALIEHQIPLNQEWIFGDREPDGRYLDIDFPEEMPTAFACNCDEVALRLIRRLTEKGWRVPEDISVIGFDDSLRSNPGITTARVDLEGMAHAAAKAMLREIGGNRQRNRVLIKGEILLRDSAAKVKI
jgi:LacI family transcriptional regulator